jgi:hypothetical protein
VAAALGFRAPHHAEISVDVDSLSVTRSSMNDMSVRIMEGDVFSPPWSPVVVPRRGPPAHHPLAVLPRPLTRRAVCECTQM